jgi:hypothetical protein
VEIVYRPFYCGGGGAQFFGVVSKTAKTMVLRAVNVRYEPTDPPYNQCGKEYAEETFREGSEPFRIKIGKYQVWDGHGVDYYPD